MARHNRRVLRLFAELGGSLSNFEEGRLKRMTDEEIQVEMIVDAIKQGFDGEAAAADPYSALSWIEMQTLATFDAMPAEEQAEWMALYGDPRREPLLWPPDALCSVRDEVRRRLGWRLGQHALVACWPAAGSVDGRLR